MKDVNAIRAAIKQSVDAVQVAEALGLKVGRNGKCLCLWHDDKVPSMKVYAGDRGCYCFACNRGGSVIDMVMQANRCSFWNAVEWLNDTFNIGLHLDHDTDPKALEEARRAAVERRAAREDEARRYMEAFDALADTSKLIADMQEQMVKYAPKPRDESFHPKYVEAVKALEILRETEKSLQDLIDRLKK